MKENTGQPLGSAAFPTTKTNTRTFTPKPSIQKGTSSEKNERMIAREEKRARLTDAAKLMLPDYQKDKELTALTNLDGEDFYEEK